MKVCVNPSCAHRVGTGSPASFRDDVARCSDCGDALSPEDAATEAAPGAKAHPRPWRALLLTISLGVAPVLARELPLPGPSADALSEGAGRTWAALPTTLHPVNTVAASMTLVTLVAALSSRWNRLRMGPENLARLTRRAWVLAAVLVAAQSVMLLTAMRSATDADLVPIPSPSPAVTLAFVASLLALTLAVSRAPSRLTLVSPLWLAATLCALRPPPPAVAQAPSSLLSLFGSYERDPLTLATTALTLAAVAWGTWRYALAERAAPSLLAASESAYRANASAPPRFTFARSPLPLGLMPALWVDALRMSPRAGEALPGLHAVAFGALVALVAAWLSHHPSRTVPLLGRLWPDADDPSRQREALALRRHAIRWGVIGTAATLAALTWMDHRLPSAASLVIPTALLTATARDVLRIYRARAAHGPLAVAWADDRMYVAAPAVALLAAHGIPAFVKNRSVRTLVPFFAIHAPLEVLVPAAQEAEARALCEASFAA